MENLTKRVFQLARSCELAHGGWVRANINQTWALNNPQLFLKQQKVGEIRPFVDNILIVNLLLCSERLSAHGLDRQKRS